MCGRFALTLPTDAVAGWFDAVHVKAMWDQPRYNICPTQDIPVAVNYEGARHLVPMRWGFIPKWYKSPTDGPMIINARSETITEKPAFRRAIIERRCLIPADGFYEWHREGGEKQPYWIRAAGSDLMAFAGIWQVWNGPAGERSVTCAMVTTEAGDKMSEVHHREPVTIAPENFGLWLGEEGKGASTLMTAQPDTFFARHKVSKAVNSSRSDGPELLEPLTEE